MKKLIAVLLAVLFVAALLPMSVSARNMTTEEKELFAYLRDAAKIIDPDGSRNSAEAIAQGENYIATLENPLTAQQIAMIKEEVQKAVDEVKSQTNGNVQDWDTDTRNEVLNHINGAAGVLDFTVTAGNKGNLTVKDETGKTIVATGNIIKTTGFSAEGLFVSATVIAVLLGATAFVSKKIRLF